MEIARPVGLVLTTALLTSAPFLAGSAAAVTFSDGTFVNSDWAATKDFDSTPSSNATFAAYQVLTGGNPGAFRETDHVWTGPGGFIVDQFQVVTVYNPAVNGPVVAINSSFDLKFVGGSAGTSQVGYEVILRQNGSVYFSPRSLAVALGPGNGLPGPWLSFGSFGLTAADFKLLVGPGPATPDFSSAGAPIQFGYLTTNGSDHGGIESTKSGIDNWSLTVVTVAMVLPQCAGPWKNHGQFVSAVAMAAEGLQRAGIITEAEKDLIVEQAAQSSCGKQ